MLEVWGLLQVFLLVCLGLYVQRAKVERAWLFGFIVGIPLWCVNLSYLTKLVVSGVWALLGASLYSSIFTGIFCLACRASKKAFYVPPALVVAEFLRSLGPFGTSWATPAQFSPTFLAFIIRLCGRMGSLFFVSLGFVALLEKRTLVRWFGALLLVGILLAGFLLPQAKETDVTLCGYGTNCSPIEGADLQRLISSALDVRADAVFLPESPSSYAYALKDVKKMRIPTNSKATVLGVGFITYEGRVFRNSYAVFGKTGPYGIRFKRRLVPFGEYIPSWLKPLGKLTLVRTNISPGSTSEAFDTPVGRICVEICWESFFVYGSWEASMRRADIVAIPAECGWVRNSKVFGTLFLNVGRVVALETGATVVLASNGGPTAVISPRGQVIEVGVGKPICGPLFARQISLVHVTEPLVIVLSFLLLALGVLSSQLSKQRTSPP